ncbi:MAG TPA: DUF192 domain-containing protein [Candidatus Saccharimonadales bacterium]|nr:DUF192 domain-containing protein [Candidatus Saccharimonadales bacterium]
MKKVFIIIFIVFIILIGTALLFYNARKNTAPTAVIDGHTFSLLVAKTNDEKQTGLSNRTSLDKNTGMLFPFGTASYVTFWMKQMRFPIDIIFIRNGKIVTIDKNAPPPQDPNSTDLPIYKPTQPADTVLEINAGLSDKDNFNIGDEVKLNNVDAIK